MHVLADQFIDTVKYKKKGEFYKNLNKKLTLKVRRFARCPCGAKGFDRVYIHPRRAYILK